MESRGTFSRRVIAPSPHSDVPGSVGAGRREDRGPEVVTTAIIRSF